MKFSNGNWLNREGVTVHAPTQVYDSTTHEDSVTLYAPCKHVSGRGGTLDGPMLTVELSSPCENVVRVRLQHFVGGAERGPHFSIADRHALVQISDGQDAVALTSGRLAVRVAKNHPFGIEFLRDGEVLTNSGFRGAAYIQEVGGTSYVREQLNIGVGETIYGLGERFTPFVKNGQSIDIWNEDGGTSSEQSYKNIPLYITNRGYGVFVNQPERVSFEVGSEKVTKVQFSVPGESLEYFFIDGPTPKEVIERYTDLTGKPALPPAWSFGLWLSTSFTTDYDEKTVNHFVDGMAARDLPLHVFHFDCFWMKEYEWCNFQWDERIFPDPVGMLQRLKAKGLRVCVWINPYIAQKSPLFQEAAREGYLVKRPDGGVWQWDLWQAGMGLVDFTNPGACDWFASKLTALLDMGVDSFKTDFGERIPLDVVYHDGSAPAGMHNYYTFLYNKVVYDTLVRARGRQEAILFARSATAGSQQFPVHWGGDCAASYESMAESLRGGLSLALCGFGFWSHDIGGFEHTATADVYKRWAAFGLLSTHSRLHGSSSYRVPWLFDDEAVDVVRFFTRLKCRLMPYLFAASCETARTGVPVMRAMLLEFPFDRAVDYVDRQYMLGESLLVAPVFSAEGTGDFYLPAGRWTHLLTHEAVEGGGWRSGSYGYESLPLFVRENTVLALGANDTVPDYEYEDGVTFHVFAMQEGGTGKAVVHRMDGTEGISVHVARRGQSLQVSVQQARSPWSVVLRGVAAVAAVAGGTVADASPLGLQIAPHTVTSSLTIQL